MNQFLLQLKEFYIANTRRSLIIIAIAVVIVLFTSWQIAYGFFAVKTRTPSGVTSPNTGQSSIDSEIKSLDLEGSIEPDQQPSPTASNPAQPGKSEGTSSTNNPTNGATTTTPPKSSTAPQPKPPVVSNVISLRNIIPQSGKVLALNGLNYNVTNYMPNVFGGIFSRSPYTFSKVAYPASLASDSISTGVANLNAALRSTPGQKIVLAHSQGAQVASHWMRQYANDPTAPSASEVTFILLGNPLRSTGGYIIGRYEVGGTIGQPTPTNTKWPIVDVARRYDGWADWVQNTNNSWAVENATAGRTAVHPRYDQVDIYASTSTVWKNSNTTYVLTKEDNLPLWDDNSIYPLGVRTAMRAFIESAYTRPANDPKTILMPIETPSWQDQLRSWGVPF